MGIPVIPKQQDLMMEAASSMPCCAACAAHLAASALPGRGASFMHACSGLLAPGM